MLGEGVKELLKEGGTSRRAAAENLVKSVGGSIEAFYYAFGETDLYVIVELPDNASMAALALTLGASGAIANKTTVLMTPEEVDKAVKKTPQLSTVWTVRGIHPNHCSMKVPPTCIMKLAARN
jgi:uncharacterized protein with GYD domain